ncbi:MAG TPA: hypothetical protein VGF14_00805 [Alphaproteobacteria bacterium]
MGFKKALQTVIDFFTGPPTEIIEPAVKPEPDLKMTYTETQQDTAPPLKTTGQTDSPEDDYSKEQKRRIAIDLSTGGPLFPQF